jgi:hypothetical protein
LGCTAHGVACPYRAANTLEFGSLKEVERLG